MPNLMTPGSALLSLIDKTKKDISHISMLKKEILNSLESETISITRFNTILNKLSSKFEHLKRLYLTGGNNPLNSVAICDILLSEPLFKDTDFQIDDHSISNDKNRRYFESALAYWTVKENINKINIDDLKQFIEASFSLLKKSKPEQYYKTIAEVLDGECTIPSFHPLHSLEFSNYIADIKNGSIFRSSDFTEEERVKIIWLIRAVYCCMLNGWARTDMPLDGIYYSHKNYTDRGRLKYDKSQSSTRSSNYGILKSYMPVLGPDDLAYSEKPSFYRRSPEYCKPDPKSESVMDCFVQLVHPYVTGISGVMLVQLCVLAKLHDSDNETAYTKSFETFSQYIQIMSCALLFCSGGHSLYEYSTVLSLDETKDTFKYLHGFADLDIESLFYTNNERAVEKAFAATIKYKNFFEKRELLHQELRTHHHRFFSLSSNTQTPSPATTTESLNCDI
ncbi:MAG: hypothetical protein P1U74_09415 [Legionellaceae bacterium]|nr:hypothetical protein [Legionellaceae bacterium]